MHWFLKCNFWKKSYTPFIDLWGNTMIEEAGVCCGPCNPSKWEDDIWGWPEVKKSAILHYRVNQGLHWACQQYGHTGGIRGWLGVEIWQLCLWDISRSAKCHQGAAVGHWVSLCVKCCRMVDSVLYMCTLSLSCSQYSQTICWRGWDDIVCLGVRNTSSKGAWPNSLDQRPPKYSILYSISAVSNSVQCRVSSLFKKNEIIWISIFCRQKKIVKFFRRFRNRENMRWDWPFIVKIWVVRLVALLCVEPKVGD